MAPPSRPKVATSRQRQRNRLPPSPPPPPPRCPDTKEGIGCPPGPRPVGAGTSQRSVPALSVGAGCPRPAALKWVSRSRSVRSVSLSSPSCGCTTPRRAPFPSAQAAPRWCVPTATLPSCSSGRASSWLMCLCSSACTWCPSTPVPLAPSPLRPIWERRPGGSPSPSSTLLLITPKLCPRVSPLPPPPTQQPGRPATCVARTAGGRWRWPTPELERAKPVAPCTSPSSTCCTCCCSSCCCTCCWRCLTTGKKPSDGWCDWPVVIRCSFCRWGTWLQTRAHDGFWSCKNTCKRQKRWVGDWDGLGCEKSGFLFSSENCHLASTFMLYKNSEVFFLSAQCGGKTTVHTDKSSQLTQLLLVYLDKYSQKDCFYKTTVQMFDQYPEMFSMILTI